MLDLRDKVTVFVITVGTPDFAECLRQLQEQDCLFTLDIIRNVSPMSAAFQQMNERCKTPYFVQVDEDMMLYPWAVRCLYDHIVAASPQVAFHCRALRDTDINVALDGCKIYRHEILKNYPWQDSYSCEVDQYQRLKNDGYTFTRAWKPSIFGDHVIGEHGRYWTPKSLFNRYKRLAVKMRLDPVNMAWWEQWPQKFLERFARCGSQRSLFAMLGWLEGLRTDLSKCSGEADFRQYDSDEAYRVFEKYFKMPDGPLVPVENEIYPYKKRIKKKAVSKKTFAPRELNIYLTSRCNFKCSWCRRQHHKMRDVPDFTAEMLAMTLNNFPSIRSACIAGFGEPLLSGNLVHVARTANEQKVPVFLITNGALIKKRFDVFKSVDFAQVSVSLNAATAEEHKTITGTETWQDVLDGIYLLKSKDIQTFVTFVISRHNLHLCGAYLDLAKSLKCPVDLLTMLPHFSDSRDNAEFWSSALLLDHPENRMWIDEFKQHPWASRVRTWPTLISKNADLCPRACRSHVETIGVDGFGNLSLCCRISPPSQEIGNICDTDAWYGEGAKNFRRIVEHGKLPDLCSMCFGNWKPSNRGE